MRRKLQYGVIGNGSWATALIKILTETNSMVYWHLRKYEYIEYIEKYGRNPRYLTEVTLDTGTLVLTADINELVEACDVVVFCVPSNFFVETAETITASLDGKYMVSAIKGLVGDANLTISEYFNQVMHVPDDHIAIISGPTHAEEVAMEHISYLTISSSNQKLTSAVCRAFECRFVQAIQSNDVLGVEYSACMKNIYSIACGICHSYRMGDNFQAVLVTNAYNEMVNFLDKINPDPTRNPSQSAYLGDLLVTCYSQFSRNRVFGEMIGKGYSVVSINAQMSMVAEGYFATRQIFKLAEKLGIRIPIIESVYNILYDGMKIRDTLKIFTSSLS